MSKERYGTFDDEELNRQIISDLYGEGDNSFVDEFETEEEWERREEYKRERSPRDDDEYDYEDSVSFIYRNQYDDIDVHKL